MKDEIRKILTEIGENPDRAGLVGTPDRVEKSYKFLTSDYSKTIDEVVNGAIFEEDYNELVLIKRYKDI